MSMELPERSRKSPTTSGDGGVSRGPGLLPEFDLIEKLRALEGGDPGVALGIGDDAAVLQPAPGCRLASCIDTLVVGVHFPPATEPADLAYKALAVNLSDLAAMGAKPRWALLSLSLNQPDRGWIERFIAGWRELAAASGLALVGGDTTATPGPVTISVQLIGELPPDQALTRGGAKAGDMIAVTGSLGGAALALTQLKAGQAPEPALLRRLNRPSPRVAAGRALLALATACIDVSDGFAADLNHLLTASGVGARVAVTDLPLHSSLTSLDRQRQLDLALGGGDDYELCFCFPSAARESVERRLAEVETPFRVVGEVTAENGVEWIGLDGRSVPTGYAHF
ncbi:MAG: thiamine-phosphate kinase [Pseudomonadota bacterium]